MRSLLFVPGDDRRKIEKSLQTQADALVLDLEDSVAPARKPQARAIVREALGADRHGKTVYVRINAFDSGEMLADLAAVMPGRPHGIVLPKCEGGEDVRRLDHMLSGVECALGIEAGRTRIIVVSTETAAAVLAHASYRDASPRLDGLIWGAEDLAGALGASANRDPAGAYKPPFELARSLCLLGAAAANVLAIDAVYTDYQDLAGLAAEARRAREDGFGCKAAIHPSQCGVINAAFMPTEAEVGWARRVLQALRGAQGQGVATLDGRMIDRPHEIQARRILQRAQSLHEACRTEPAVDF
ncbi:MAG: CoA ester lyase [Variovorax sp.]|nr:CoA ester lyase [Variovorax sp.]